MPRTARIKGISGNYHIVLRGINKQQIFEEPQDYAKFMWILKDQHTRYGFSLFAWCLMPNHVHLLIKEKAVPISQIMREICTSFVYWYNSKYKRSGHLFEGRFRSEPVDDEAYFLKVVRYIHLNPVEAGICRCPEDYPYSSYSHLFSNGKHSGSDPVFGLIDRDEFELFHKEKNEDICLDIDSSPVRRITDEQAAHIGMQISGCERIAMVRELPADACEKTVKGLLKYGASVRQINRLTGLTVRTIEFYRDKR